MRLNHRYVKYIITKITAPEFAPEYSRRLTADGKIWRDALAGVRNPWERELLESLRATALDVTISAEETHRRQIEAILKNYRREFGKRTSELPDVSFEPDRVCIEFCSLGDLRLGIARLIAWLDRNAEAFAVLIRPKAPGE